MTTRRDGRPLYLRRIGVVAHAVDDDPPVVVAPFPDDQILPGVLHTSLLAVEGVPCRYCKPPSGETAATPVRPSNG